MILNVARPQGVAVQHGAAEYAVLQTKTPINALAAVFDDRVMRIDLWWHDTGKEQWHVFHFQMTALHYAGYMGGGSA